MGADRRRLLLRLVSAQEEERRRIAGALHDDQVQTLVSVARRLEDYLVTRSDPEERLTVRDILEDVEGVVQRLRRLTFELRPVALEHLGLAAAIRASLDDDAEVFGIRLDDRLPEEPPLETATTLFRIAQEALSNVRRHAHPEEVSITLRCEGGGYHLTVHDDGVGFEPSDGEEPGHLGMISMRERAEMAGGWLEVASIPGDGTEVRAWVPV